MKQTENEARFLKKIEDEKRRINALAEENAALRQLLDCAAANMVLLAKDKGKSFRIKKDEVKNTLGRYSLNAARDKDGNYILSVTETAGA